jgi:hypothetical protein
VNASPSESQTLFSVLLLAFREKLRRLGIVLPQDL